MSPTTRAKPTAVFQLSSITAACLTVCLAVAPPCSGQTAENVAVIVNQNSADSQRIAEHYARTRELPESNVLRIQTSTDEAIERDAYVRTIELPLSLAIRRAGLQDRLLYLVLTKGIPLRIAGTTGPNGTIASVESELRSCGGWSVNRFCCGDRSRIRTGARGIGEARPFSSRARHLPGHSDQRVYRRSGVVPDRSSAKTVDRWPHRPRPAWNWRER
jgi:hypothetical protein